MLIKGSVHVKFRSEDQRVIHTLATFREGVLADTPYNEQNTHRHQRPTYRVLTLRDADSYTRKDPEISGVCFCYALKTAGEKLARVAQRQRNRFVIGRLRVRIPPRAPTEANREAGIDREQA